MNKVLSFILMLFFSLQLHAQQGGYALKFNGNNAVSAPLDVSGLSEFSIEVWVKWQPQTGNEIEFICGKAFEEMELHTTSGNGIRFIPTTGVYLDAPNVLPAGVWTHIAAIYQPSTLSASLYINGKEVNITNNGSRSVGEPLQNSLDDFQIGRRIIAETPYYFNGFIDELRVWNSVRTTTEIKANMYKEINTHANLKAYYKMSDGTGSSLTDNSGNGNTGTLVNGPEWKLSGCFAGSGQALDFDGTDEYVSVPHNASLNMGIGNFTYEFWVKKSNSGVRYDLISKEGTDQNNDLSILISETNQAVFYTKESASDHAVTTIQTIPTGTWVHIAGVRDGNALKVYVNGVLDNTSTGTAQNLTNTNVMLLAANYNTDGNNGFFNGQLDEVRIWSTARTESELRENMVRTLVGNESGLVAYYRFDHKDGSTLHDITSNANNGTLTNMNSATDWVPSTAFNTWLGGENSEWSNTANWSNGIPVSTQSIGLYKWNLDNITTYEANVSGSPTMNNLLISSGSAPTLSSGLTVNGNLLLEKNMSLNGQTVTLGPLGYLAEGNGYFYGANGMITTTRTLNNISAQNVAGLGAVLTSAANLGLTTISRNHASRANVPFGSSVLRTYNIVPAINNGLDATLVYQYREAELNSLTEASLSLYSSTDGGNSFMRQGGVLNTTDKTLTLSGLNSFSIWTAGKDCSTTALNYRTNEDLSWSSDREWMSPSNWKKYNGSTWEVSHTYPGQFNDGCATPLVTIQAGHQVQIQTGGNINIPNLKIEGTGKLTIKSGGKIYVQDQLQLDENAGGAIVVE